MASLDMQQTVLNEIIGNEATQEEIQLTELLPVKQSRIVENDTFEETEVEVEVETDPDADALKVLQSFNISDEREQQQREFQSGNNLVFCSRVQRQEKQGRGEKSRYGRGSNNGDDVDFYDDSELEAKETISDQTFENGAIRKRRKDAKSSKCKAVDGGGVRDKEESEYNEEPTYLDLDRSHHLNDEIYVFRRELSDSEQRRYANSNNAVNAANTANAANTVARICENDYPTTTDGELFAQVAVSRREASVVDERIDERIDERNDEGENNNVVRSNQSKIAKDRSPARKRNEIANEENKEGGDVGEENEQKRYRCVVCEARFKGSGGLRNHYKIVHGAGPVFKCDECGKEFPLKERLKLHVRTHTGFKPYKCSECDKSFARGGQLVQHRRTHSQVKPYRCGLCSGTFTCAANLALHVKRHNGQKDHKCEICGRAFVRRDALKKHLECLHRDVKSFLCVICNKTFKGHLPQHMRTHARDRPHGCATCGQRFAQKSQLTVHQRTHSGQRPFRCLVCWQAFAHSTALKLHTRRHTGERPFKCAECNAGFTQLPHWKKHMKCIHGRNEPYACKKCKSFFRIKNDLECHEKTCHPEFALEPANSERSANNDDQSDARPVSGEFLADKPSPPPPSKYRLMTVERMRLLLAVLLKRISKQEKLDELGFGKRLIDEVLHDSLISAGKDPVASKGLSELETLTKNLEIFLKWTVPKEHWENFRRLNKTPEDILETLTAT